VVLVLAQLLTAATECTLYDSKPACTASQRSFSLTIAQQHALAMLSTRRDLILIATLNCIGYKYHFRDDVSTVFTIKQPSSTDLHSITSHRDSIEHNRHPLTQSRVDPNRDYSYSRKNNHCFLSSSAKILYYITKYNILQVVVTYHGGMIALGYEWGSREHMTPHDRSQDDSANRGIAKNMQLFAGKCEDNKLYPGKLI
jgi:hypothetical protein